MKVLIVEDEDVSLAKLEHDLKDLGVKIIKKFKKGLDALDHLGYNHYDLLIIDMKLPDIPGHKLIRSIRQNDLVTKIIIVSGTINREVFDKCVGLCIEDILCKPYNKERLTQHIPSKEKNN